MEASLGVHRGGKSVQTSPRSKRIGGRAAFEAHQSSDVMPSKSLADIGRDVLRENTFMSKIHAPAPLRASCLHSRTACHALGHL